MDKEQIWVVRRVASFVSCPPRAIVAPRMLSLSMMGRSPQVTITCENIIRGSGEKVRTFACLRRAIDVVIQSVVTTGIMIACDSVNWVKSIVLETICVTFSMGREPSRRGSQTVAPLSWTILDSCDKCLLAISSMSREEVDIHRL